MEPTTQDFLELKDIKEGVVLLKNNDIRGILMVSSMNFALKAAEEQVAIIDAFQNFLNSLDFSCQIVVQSRNINITPYLDSIKTLEAKQNNPLMKTQIGSYVDFISELVEGESIMTKSFYIVVPYTIAEALGSTAVIKKLSILSAFKKKGDEQAQGEAQRIEDEEFQKVKNQLWQRMEFLASGLKRCGLDVVPLTTPELIELFWSTYHPEEAEVGYYPEILPELLR